MRTATTADESAMVPIFVDAFSGDRHTQMQVASGRDPSRGMAEAIGSWIASSRCDVIIAVDEKDDPVGWACWIRHGYEPSETDQKRSRPEPEAASGEELVADSVRAVELQELTGKHLQEWQAKIMSEGTRCRILAAIAVSPTVQGNGVGSSLVGWGTDRADEDHVFAWVHSSEAGVKLFEKAGFEERQQLDVDLDAFAPERSTETWGRYVFRYLVREPVVPCP